MGDTVADIKQTGDADLTCRSRRVLLVEDDTDISSLLSAHLHDNGAEVVQVANGREGLHRALHEFWDLLILDLTLPDVDGIQIATELKRRLPALPIIIMTARNSESERVHGLDSGADDYVIKPFSMLEMVARVRAVIRRTDALKLPAQNTVLRAGDIVLDADSHCAYVAEKRVELTAREFGLLAEFVRHPGKVFSRAELLSRVWDSTYEGYRHTVNTHINRLRGKLEPNPSQPTHILTVWGVGYKLKA